MATPVIFEQTDRYVRYMGYLSFRFVGRYPAVQSLPHDISLSL